MGFKKENLVFRRIKKKKSQRAINRRYKSKVWKRNFKIKREKTNHGLTKREKINNLFFLDVFIIYFTLYNFKL